MWLAVNGTSERWILPIKAKNRSEVHPSGTRAPSDHSEIPIPAMRTRPSIQKPVLVPSGSPNPIGQIGQKTVSAPVKPSHQPEACPHASSVHPPMPTDRHGTHPILLSIPRLMRGCSPCFTHNPEPLQRSHQTGDCWRGTNRRRVGPTRDDSRGCATTGAAMQATGGAHEKSFENKG